MLGKDREAGCEARIGISKKVSASMPPEPIKLVQAERMRVVLMKGEDMVVRCDGFVFESCLSAVVQRYM